jgi:hypothetical protein
MAAIREDKNVKSLGHRWSLWAGITGLALVGQIAIAQSTTTHKPKSTAKTTMAVWTPEVQQTLGLSASDFTTVGLNRLTKAQLATLVAAAPDQKKQVLTCPANGTAPAGVLHVLVTVAGEDSTGNIATAIRTAVQSLTGVEVVDQPANADRAMHVVIQEQTMGKRTIGFTAAYVTGTPCGDSFGTKKTDVELKGQLGTYTDPKGADLARDLAGMLDQDLRPLRTASLK